MQARARKNGVDKRIEFIVRAFARRMRNCVSHIAPAFAQRMRNHVSYVSV